MSVLKLSKALLIHTLYLKFQIIISKNHLQSCAANLTTFGRKTTGIHNKPVKGPGGCIGEIAKKEAMALLNTLRYEKEPIPVISA